MSDVNLLPLTVVQKLVEIGIPQDSLIFYQDGRWVYQVGQVISNNNRFHCQPIDSLGPFEIHEVDISFILLPSTSQYRITRILGRKLSPTEQVTGIYAPVAPITLEGFARSTAHIPDDATHFCWLYPLKFTFNGGDYTSNNSDESNLCKIGGFAYFNTTDNNIDELRLIRVNSLIVPANNGLTFEGPYPWKKEFTDRLWTQDRFQPVTLPCLLEKGARYFAFINPYESLFSENGQISWKPSPHGAFVYLFNEDHSPHVFDCFFSVADNCLGVSPSDEE
ncbi:unnamed protein product [Rotaria sp. Silwood1]|nr:unnamed protein product [Rotaria sp. Silwood1]CAF4737777.1 unnamed protein product [Rotaria sp. Silwood1]CAF4860603.1 unnamed protein product [Rotaria sp. Silwood1]